MRKLSVWLAVYNLISLLQLARCIFLLRVWKVSRDPALKQVKVDLFCGSFVYLFEIVWLIYGNTFIYSKSTGDCKGHDQEDVEAYSLWVSALLIIVYGYCLMLYFTLVCCFAFGLCILYRSWRLDITQ